MLAAVQALSPDGTVALNSTVVTFAGHGATARFAVRAPDGGQISCEIITDRTPAGAQPANIREFELNDARFSIGGGKDAQGAYCAQIETPWGTFERPDMLRLTVREFLAGETAIDGTPAVTNLTWLLGMADRA